MTADEVLKAIEARRNPYVKHHTNDDVVKVQWSEILVLEEAIDELRAQIAAVKSEVSKGLGDYYLEGMAGEVLRLLEEKKP